MFEVTATFEIVTPMFLGDADQQANRIRESSIKGALAFWWRALNYCKFAANKSPEQALREMQKRELELFGGPDRQSGFLLRVERGIGKDDLIHERCILGKDGTGFKTPKRNDERTVGVGARYLGYGLINAFYTRGNPEKGNPEKQPGELERSCIMANRTFSVSFLFNRSMSETDIDEITTAIKLFGLLGGLGSRVRRGWGSVSLIKLQSDSLDVKWSPANNKQSYQDQLAALFPKDQMRLSGCGFPLTAFAKESRVWMADKKLSNRKSSSQDAIWNNPLEALDWLGRALLDYRAWGRNGKFGEQAVQQQFIEDHHWFRKGSNDGDIPFRTAFGLPHMYDSKKHQGVSIADNGDDPGRRASPMLMHIHKIGGSFVAVVTLIPTSYAQKDIIAKNSRNQTTSKHFDLYERYGTKKASGLDVLMDFVGHRDGKFSPNRLISFTQVLP